MITVVRLVTSRSQRIVRLLEESGLPREIERFDRRPDGFAPDDVKRVSPTAGRQRCASVTWRWRDLAPSSALSWRATAAAAGRCGPRLPRLPVLAHHSEGSLGAQPLRTPTRAPAWHGSGTTFATASPAWKTRSAFTAADIRMPFRFATAQRFRPPARSSAPPLARIVARPAYRRAVELAGPDVTG